MDAGERTSCRVAVAVLNWNGAAHLRRFLPSVVAHNVPGDRVVVIDNGSDDESLKVLEASFPEVDVVTLSENLGFAGGYNAGLSIVSERFDAQYVLLLNSDVEVTAGWVDVMVETAERHQWTAVQPKIRAVDRRAEFEYAGAAGGYMDRFGFMFCAGRIFDAFESDMGQYDQERPVFWASGAALMVKRSAWEEVQGLDVDFFAHMEEIDLCWRLRNRGHVVGVATGTHVYHLGGGTLGQSSPRKAELNFRNNLFLLLKNDHRFGIRGRIFFRQLLDGVAALRFLTEGKPDFFRAVIKAHGDFRKLRSRMWEKRMAERKACASASVNHLTDSGRYHGSIIVDYFIRGRKRFSDLPARLFR